MKIDIENHHAVQVIDLPHGGLFEYDGSVYMMGWSAGGGHAPHRENVLAIDLEDGQVLEFISTTMVRPLEITQNLKVRR